MAIPEFREDGWLPEGHWPATWEEIEARFGGVEGTKRSLLLARLINWRNDLWRNDLWKARVTGRLLLDGSFVSSKPVPGDVDALFIIDEQGESVAAERADAMELISHPLIKARGIGDVFCFMETSVQAFPRLCRIDGFDIVKGTNRRKGLVEVLV